MPPPSLFLLVLAMAAVLAIFMILWEVIFGDDEPSSTSCGLFHNWGPWRSGTYYETSYGRRTGRTSRAAGRECVSCGKVQSRPA